MQIEEHLRDHAMDEHESLKLFTSDLEGMQLGDEGYDDKLHQLMEVGPVTDTASRRPLDQQLCDRGAEELHLHRHGLVLKSHCRELLQWRPKHHNTVQVLWQYVLRLLKTN